MKEKLEEIMSQMQNTDNKEIYQALEQAYNYGWKQGQTDAYKTVKDIFGWRAG